MLVWRGANPRVACHLWPCCHGSPHPQRVIRLGLRCPRIDQVPRDRECMIDLLGTAHAGSIGTEPVSVGGPPPTCLMMKSFQSRPGSTSHCRNAIAPKPRFDAPTGRVGFIYEPCIHNPRNPTNRWSLSRAAALSRIGGHRSHTRCIRQDLAVRDRQQRSSLTVLWEIVDRIEGNRFSGAMPHADFCSNWIRYSSA